jgi:hypothetical protein
VSVKAFLTAEHMVVREEGRSQEVLERFFRRRRLQRKVAVYTSHFLGVPSMLSHVGPHRHDPVRSRPAVRGDVAAAGGRVTPFDIAGFDLKLHWHRRFDNEPRNSGFATS